MSDKENNQDTNQENNQETEQIEDIQDSNNQTIETKPKLVHKALMNLEESIAYDEDNKWWFIGEYVGHKLLGNFFLQHETIYFRQISIPKLDSDNLFVAGFCLYVDSNFLLIEKELAKCCIKSHRDKDGKLKPCDATVVTIWNRILPANKQDRLIVI